MKLIAGDCRGDTFDSSPLITARRLDTVPALMRVILPIRRDLPTRLVVGVFETDTFERLPIFASRIFTRLAHPVALGDRVDSVTVQIVTVVTTKRPCIERHGRYLSRQIHDELTFSETRELARRLIRGCNDR